MERDFLGISGTGSEPPAKDDGRGGGGAFNGGSAMQWHFANKPPLHAVMALKSSQEENPQRLVFDHYPPSGFQPLSPINSFNANQKSSSAFTPQKFFGLDRPSFEQNDMHAYQSQSADSFGSSARHMSRSRVFPAISNHSIPGAGCGSFYRVHGKQQPFSGGIPLGTRVANSKVVNFAPRNVLKPLPTPAQLTIFYAGAVNVFDNISQEKAHEIMILATKSSNMTSTSLGPKLELPTKPTTNVEVSDGVNASQKLSPKQDCDAPPCSGIPTPTSVMLQMGALSGSISCICDDLKAARPSSPHKHGPTKNLTAVSGPTATAAIISRAVPQARKASLTRFLEKRKERSSNSMPYPCTVKSSETNIGVENNNIPSKSSSTDLTLTGNHESSSLGQPKNSSHSEGSPSTRLVI